MRYEVWNVNIEWMLPSCAETFHHYQDAKKYAKELAKKEETYKVWIYAIELIKGPEYF